jgi:predicted RNA-binding protein YlxR (DUF448 family)
VVAVEGALVPDPARRLPGRGAHLHHDPACLALAERRRAWPRALHVAGPLDVADVVAHLAAQEHRSAGALGAGSRQEKDDPTDELPMSTSSR